MICSPALVCAEPGKCARMAFRLCRNRRSQTAEAAAGGLPCGRMGVPPEPAKKRKSDPCGGVASIAKKLFGNNGGVRGILADAFDAVHAACLCFVAFAGGNDLAVAGF